MTRERFNAAAAELVAERLRQLRNARGMVQADVSLDTDINISRAESGSANISISTLADLCAYYGVTLREFFDLPEAERQ